MEWTHCRSFSVAGSPLKFLSIFRGRAPSTTGTRAVWRSWSGNRKPSASA